MPRLGATVAVAVTGWPCVRLADESCNVVMEERSMTFCQLVARFAALTDPQPVAKSYPAPAVVPVWPGTLLFPTVMSLKMHCACGGPLALQFAAFWPAANGYRTKFACPCRALVFCAMSAMIAANVGAAADVPPTNSALINWPLAFVVQIPSWHSK